MSDVTMRLELIAAKAKQLASDEENGRLWEGDLSRGLSDLLRYVQQAQSDARRR